MDPFPFIKRYQIDCIISGVGAISFLSCFHNGTLPVDWQQVLQVELSSEKVQHSMRADQEPLPYRNRTERFCGKRSDLLHHSSSSSSATLTTKHPCSIPGNMSSLFIVHLHCWCWFLSADVISGRRKRRRQRTKRTWLKQRERAQPLQKPLLLLEDKIYGSACLRVRLDGQNAIENESGMKENAYDMIYEWRSV